MTNNDSNGRASAHDVAERAGVSRSTVSRALSDHPRISQSTRERVRRAADELQYRPHALASMLARGETGTIGMAVPAFDRWYFSQVVSAAEEVLNEAGLDLVLYRVRTGEERTFLIEETPFRNRVDALLLVGVVPDADEVEHLHAISTTTVTIGARADGLSSVNVDDVAGGQRLTDHLLGLGHRSIAMLTGPIDESVRHQVLRDRRRGYTQTVGAAGLEAVCLTSGIDFEAGIRATIKLLSERRETTAIFAATDEIAAGAVRAARDVGLDVPRDLSVVGFDDHWIAAAMDLTTVNQSVRSHGTEGAALLLEHLAEPTVPPRDVLIPPRLIVRASTAPPRASRAADHGGG